MTMHHIHAYLGQPRAKPPLSTPPPSTSVSSPSIWSRNVCSCPVPSHLGQQEVVEKVTHKPSDLNQPLQKTQQFDTLWSHTLFSEG